MFNTYLIITSIINIDIIVNSALKFVLEFVASAESCCTAMACADGGEKEPDGSQLAVPDDPQVAGGDEQMGENELHCFPEDEEEQEGGESQLAVSDGPERLTIGTRNAFNNNYAFLYEKRKFGDETLYVCSKGSEWARADEVLVLRCERGTWTAYDSALTASGGTLLRRQAVFRCFATDITQPGPYKWEINHAASLTNGSSAENWHGDLWAETRVP